MEPSPSLGQSGHPAWDSHHLQTTGAQNMQASGMVSEGLFPDTHQMGLLPHPTDPKLRRTSRPHPSH
jgi:hypothetical protein